MDLMRIYPVKPKWYLLDNKNMSKKNTWSLQNDKRTEEERNVFKPSGKKPKNKTKMYLLSLAGVFLIVSFLMTYFSETVMESCLAKTFCFNSKDDIVIYTLYVFLNIVIVISAIFGAYIIGRKLAKLIKK
jgi:uncharacterized protein YqhQ